jgi:lysophospholipase L1-like esterase
MMELLPGLGGVAALALGALAYGGRRMEQLPAGNPAEVLAAGPLPTHLPVVVCLGDSITQGALGADWVGTLRRRLADQALVVNAGVGGQVTWDLRQRLDQVARCGPAAILLMSGSNDAVGALGGGWASFYEKGRPQAPSEEWFGQQYAELVAMTPTVACLTLPPLGEDPSAAAEAIARRQNDAIRACAAEHGADVHAACWRLLPPAAPGVPFLRGLPKFMAWTVSSTLKHRLLGRSWDQIARGRGLTLTADTIHPSDRAAAALLDLIEPWARYALSFGSTP